MSVIVWVSPLGRYGGLAEQSELLHEASRVRSSDPSPRKTSTGPVTPAVMTRSLPEPSKSLITAGLELSPTKSIDWS